MKGGGGGGVKEERTYPFVCRVCDDTRVAYEAFVVLGETKSLGLGFARSAAAHHGRCRRWRVMKCGDGSAGSWIVPQPNGIRDGRPQYRRGVGICVGGGFERGRDHQESRRRPMRGNWGEHTWSVRVGEVLIRSWREEDREPCAELIGRVLWEYGLGWDSGGADRDVVEVETSYWDSGGEFWVVEREDGSEVCGTAGFYPVCLNGEIVVEIRKMYLDQTMRGRGLGRFLLDALEARVWQLGYRHVVIETASVLREAVGLYHSAGYRALQGSKNPTLRCDMMLEKRLGVTVDQVEGSDIPCERGDVVDEKGFLLIPGVLRAEIRKLAVTHYGVGILVVNHQGRVVVHQRASQKKPYPNHFDMFVGGAVASGENALDAAQREVAEEIGLHKLSYQYVFDCVCTTPENRCFVTVFRAEGDFDERDLTFQKEEVATGELMTREKLAQHIRHRPYVSDGLLVWDLCKKFLIDGSFDLSTAVAEAESTHKPSGASN